MSAARRQMKDRVAQLRHIPFVAGCTFDELAEVDRLGAQIDVREGRTLIHEGDVGRECFVVLTGAALAERAGRALGAIAAGSIAGEMALLDHTVRTATVVAGTPMRLLVLTAREFVDLVRISPTIETNLRRIAIERWAALESLPATPLVRQ